MSKHSKKTSYRRIAGTGVLAVAAVVAGAGLSATAAAAAVGSDSAAPTTTVPRTTVPTAAPAKGAKFIAARQQTETGLTGRVTQLARLTTEVNGATTLQSDHAKLLTARLATETTSIGALAAKVPNDNTWAELNADRQAMLKDNRVFATMTSQVYETIEADSLAAQVSTLQGQKAALETAVTTDVGQPGYKTAASHLADFIRKVDQASQLTTGVAVRVLAQMPQQWPNDEHVFVTANEALLKADIDMAHANYDASVIGLATGG